MVVKDGPKPENERERERERERESLGREKHGRAGSYKAIDKSTGEGIAEERNFVLNFEFEKEVFISSPKKFQTTGAGHGLLSKLKGALKKICTNSHKKRKGAGAGRKRRA